MTIQVGDKVPSVNFKKLTADGLSDVSSDSYFKGRKVALFSVPGAFTPTCSAQHVPSYVENSEALKGKGVSAVACVSVNDAFVMKAWGEAHGTGENVLMLADGNADLAKALGLEFDGSAIGFGIRSQRYALVANDGVVEALAVEAPMKFEVSSAEAILEKL